MKEIVIIANEENKSADKGKFFETLANRIFKSQRYKVRGNVNYTGMEFDLECEHLDREGESALVECKARLNLSTEDIRTFAFNTQFKNFDHGFFLYTREYEHQAAGLIKEVKADPRYKNLHFWNAEKIVELLVSANEIKPLTLTVEGFSISKEILIYCHFGIFHIALLSNSTLPSEYCVWNAQTLEPISEKDVISKLNESVKEIESLALHSIASIGQSRTLQSQPVSIMETVAEVQEAESWDDTKPASTKYFVGRKKLKEQVFGFLSDAINRRTQKRSFYIQGKSGWGKSSLLNELKGRSRNKHYKNKYFVFVVDSRSAHSDNFVALAFNKMLDKAANEQFIPEELTNISAPSAFDLLASDKTTELLDTLRSNNKLMLIVFDQFEDIFRKGRIFESFYKFLIDVNDREANLVIGFSWKSEVNVTIDHAAYHLWQQSKDYARALTLEEFEFGESRAIVKQLESSIGKKLGIDYINKIVHSSQGFPWLVKKLCIHISKQCKQGLSVDDLYDRDFNVETLFEDDLEELNPDEVRSLKYIAKRAYDNNALDMTEVDEIIDNDVLQGLIHRRLVIKSGTKHNIYWDIFRDYLVTGEVPRIGETYLLRQPVTTVLDGFLCFGTNKSLSLSEFINTIPNSIAEGAALNILRELRSIGLIVYRNEKYHLNYQEKEVSEKAFREFLSRKLCNHSFYLELIRIDRPEIELDDITQIIRRKIKGTNFAEKTIQTYSQIFVSWLNFANLKIHNLNPKVIIRARNALSFTPQMKPEEVVGFLQKLRGGQTIQKDRTTSKLLYDLKYLGFIDYSRNKISLTSDGIKAKSGSRKLLESAVASNALKTDKIKLSYQKITENPLLTRKEFRLEIQDILEGLTSTVYANKTSRYLYQWAWYIQNTLGNIEN